MKGVPCLLVKVTATEQPLLTLYSSLLAVTITAQGEVAMGDKIRDYNLGGRGVCSLVCQEVVGLLLHCQSATLKSRLIRVARREERTTGMSSRSLGWSHQGFLIIWQLGRWSHVKHGPIKIEVWHRERSQDFL